MTARDWATEFATIISCARCDKSTCMKILRDSTENVPQPGFIGTGFQEKRILIVGQNPGIPNDRLAPNDRNYTRSLRRLRDQKTEESWTQLQNELMEFVPSWPVHGSYFPLQESGLSLHDIAYCNIVRCRTEGNAQPSARMSSGCAHHFTRWLDLLKPRAVVFIGKWAHDHGAHFVHERQIPFDFMNRERSLSSAGRIYNRQRVVAFIQKIVSA